MLCQESSVSRLISHATGAELTRRGETSDDRSRAQTPRQPCPITPLMLARASRRLTPSPTTFSAMTRSAPLLEPFGELNGQHAEKPVHSMVFRRRNYTRIYPALALANVQDSACYSHRSPTQIGLEQIRGYALTCSAFCKLARNRSSSAIACSSLYPSVNKAKVHRQPTLSEKEEAPGHHYQP
jgi:hypothetical protein